MLLLKLTLVPFFIAVVTLAGRKWGLRAAGILGGLPVIAGPIIFILTLEYGSAFAAVAATAAISAIASLLGFGIGYSWAGRRFSWPLALACGVVIWFIVAGVLSQLPQNPWLATFIAGMALLITPSLLPASVAPAQPPPKLADMPFRMAAGALLTLGVTGAASVVGGIWSGLLSVFPVIGLVMAVFTHRSQGADQVSLLVQGMVRGLYSFAAYFLVFSLSVVFLGLLKACLLSILAAAVVQAIAQGLIIQRAKKNRLKER